MKPKGRREEVHQMLVRPVSSKQSFHSSFPVVAEVAIFNTRLLFWGDFGVYLRVSVCGEEVLSLAYDKILVVRLKTVAKISFLWLW